MAHRRVSFHAPRIYLPLVPRPVAPCVIVSTTSTTTTTTITSVSSALAETAAIAAAGANPIKQCKILSSTPQSSVTVVPTTTPRPSHPPSCYFGASEIIPGLFLGDYADAANLPALRARNIRRVLNVAAECPIPHDIEHNFITKHVALHDHSDENIAAHFEECLSYIREGLACREGVLVHCRMGISRSATIVLAYIMRYGIKQQQQQQPKKGEKQEEGEEGSSRWEISRDEEEAAAEATEETPYAAAFQFVKSRRVEVNPNFGFCLALRGLDIQHGLRTNLWADHDNVDDGDDDDLGEKRLEQHVTKKMVVASC